MAKDSFLLDANACVNLLRATSPELIEQFQARQPADIVMSAIVVAELNYGAHNSKDSARNMQRTEAFIKPFRILPFDTRCARIYGRIRSALKTRGQMIGANDLFVAATAIAFDATLVTHNVREFSRVPELSFIDWEVPG